MTVLTCAARFSQQYIISFPLLARAMSSRPARPLCETALQGQVHRPHCCTTVRRHDRGHTTAAHGRHRAPLTRCRESSEDMVCSSLRGIFLYTGQRFGAPILGGAKTRSF